MTADERIEKLLNAFGQTIADLPKPTEEGYAYEKDHRIRAREAALTWSDVRYAACPFLNDYICHMADIIDRMEIALETARRWGSCSKCRHFYSDEEPEEGTCQCSHNYNEFDDRFAIDDLFLTGGMPIETDT